MNLLKAISMGMLVGQAAGYAAPAAPEDVAVAEEMCECPCIDKLDANETDARGRELFPVLPGAKRLRSRTARGGASPSAANAIAMKVGNADGVKGPINALEMLSLNDELNTVVQAPDFCTRRHAMARAAGLAAGLALSAVNAPGYAAATSTVKMGSDSGQLVFVPDEIKICKGDTVTWTNNKGGPHNVVFDEDNIPGGVDAESISMDDQLGDEGDTYSKKFDTAGSYSYYCEPHRGAGMNAVLVVS